MPRRTLHAVEMSARRFTNGRIRAALHVHALIDTNGMEDNFIAFVSDYFNIPLSYVPYKAIKEAQTASELALCKSVCRCASKVARFN